jgi:hypothetical protein
MPHYIFTLDFLTKTILLLAVLQGLFVSIFSWLQKTETKTARFLFSFLISAVSITLLNDLLQKFNVFQKNPQWLFLPIFYTMWFGPLLFFYVKAALYPSFRLHFKDIKHFFLPWAQFIFFTIMFFYPFEKKQTYWLNDYSFFYGTFAYPIYLFSFTIYTYFSYRFIRHKIKALRHTEHDKKENHRINRLRQVIKGWYILLLINSSFIVLNFLSQHFFHYSLHNNRLYSFLSDMSFAAMVVWLAAYGYYKVAKGLGLWDFLKEKLFFK